MEKSVIVYGPQGSGKTKMASEIMKHFKLKKLIEEAWPGVNIPKHGALVLTNVTPDEMSPITKAFLEDRIYSIDEIKNILPKPKGV
jgi:replication-associated recombination protein RarA